MPPGDSRIDEERLKKDAEYRRRVLANSGQPNLTQNAAHAVGGALSLMGLNDRGWQPPPGSDPIGSLVQGMATDPIRMLGLGGTWGQPPSRNPWANFGAAPGAAPPSGGTLHGDFTDASAPSGLPPVGGSGSGFASIRNLLGMAALPSIGMRFPAYHGPDLSHTYDAATAMQQKQYEDAQAAMQQESAATKAAMAMPSMPDLYETPPRDLAGVALPALLTNMASAISGNESYRSGFQGRLTTEDQDRLAAAQQNTLNKRAATMEEYHNNLQMHIQQLQAARDQLNRAGQGMMALELDKAQLDAQQELQDAQVQHADTITQITANADLMAKQQQNQIALFGQMTDYAAKMGAVIHKDGTIKITDPAKFTAAGPDGKLLADLIGHLDDLASGKGPKSDYGKLAFQTTSQAIDRINQSVAEDAYKGRTPEQIIQIVSNQTDVKDPNDYTVDTVEAKAKYAGFLAAALYALKSNYDPVRTPAMLKKIKAQYDALDKIKVPGEGEKK